MKTTKLMSLLLVLVLVFGAIGASAEGVVYERADDEDIYEEVLGEYEALIEAAKAAETVDETFVLEAQAEAYLLDSAVMIPTTTQNGAYTISRAAYRTGPYANWGNDDDRVKGVVLTNEFITTEDWEELKAAWNAAVAGEGEYDAEAILAAKGYTFNYDYRTTFSTAPVTLDWLNTSSQSDTEITVNTVDGLVEYDNLGVMQPALAESWEISDDGLTYTFHIREGAYWYTSEGTQYAEVTANDFVAGFHHMLDTQAGLEWLVEGIVAGAGEYLYEGGSFDDVGYKAVDDHTLVVTLAQPTSYFMTMLTYSCFLPICDEFYQSRGGVYGIEEYAEASADSNTYTFGMSTDVASQVYCGPYLVQKLNSDSEIDLVRNENYWNPESVRLNSITWIYDAGENPTQTYNDVVNNVYPGMTLSPANGTLELAKADGNFDKYQHISETTSTTYFGGLNLNRGTYVLASGAAASPQTDADMVNTHTALMNRNFRKAFVKAFDKETYNAVIRGEDLALTNLRNMYTRPDFVQLSADVTDADGHTFPAGTLYGDMVQYYLDQLDGEIQVADGVNGWYAPESAREYLEKAKEELGDTVTWPVQIDITYYSASESMVAQAQAFKSIMEENLGAENIQINLIETTTADDYYACGYRAANGEAGNFDFFQGSGWGPDYGDPFTYLETFLGYGAGYMTKVIGLF